MLHPSPPAVWADTQTGQTLVRPFPGNECWVHLYYGHGGRMNWQVRFPQWWRKQYTRTLPR